MKNNCDIVLVRPNDKKAVYNGIPQNSTASDPPYWLALMGGWLKKYGINVYLIDAEAENTSPEETTKQIKNLNPHLVGLLTIGSNLTASTWKMNGASILAREVKKLSPTLPIFMWGFHVSAIPERTLQEEECDFVIVGEGFQTIFELIQYILRDNKQYDNIDGLWYKHAGKINGNRNIQLLKNLDDLPYDGWDLLPMVSYKNHMHFALEDLTQRDRYGVIMTSLGCPYSCSYCSITYFSGDKKVRYKSAQKSIEEVDYWVKNHNIYYLRILDECFTTNHQHVKEFCELLINRNYNLSIWVYARTDQVNKELLELMYKAGIRWIAYGFESGNKEIRSSVQKGQYTIEHIQEVVKMTHDAGLYICANFMFGLPDDTLESMQETLNLAQELNCEHQNMYCTMAYPGSKLYQQAIKEGWELPNTWLGYAQLSYEFHPLSTKHLTSAEILAFRDKAFMMFYENNPKYFSMIEKKFGQVGVAEINKMLEGYIPRKLLEKQETTKLT